MGLNDSIEKYKKAHEDLNSEITDNLIQRYVPEVFGNLKNRVEVGKVYDAEDIDTILSEELCQSQNNFTIYLYDALQEYFSSVDNADEVNFKDDYEIELYDVLNELFEKIILYDSYGTNLDEAVIKFEFEVVKIRTFGYDEFVCDIKITSLELVYPEGIGEKNVQP